jgi:hypothetical protein
VRHTSYSAAPPVRPNNPRDSYPARAPRACPPDRSGPVFSCDQYYEHRPAQWRGRGRVAALHKSTRPNRLSPSAAPPVWYIPQLVTTNLVTKNLAPGTIVILHDRISNPTRNLQALPQILTAAHRKPCLFVTVAASFCATTVAQAILVKLVSRWF